jgi:hypothetical protein
VTIGTRRTTKCGWVRHGLNGPLIYELASYRTGPVQSTAGPSKSSSPCDKRPWWKEGKQAVRRRSRGRSRLSHTRVAPRRPSMGVFVDGGADRGEREAALASAVAAGGSR